MQRLYTSEETELLKEVGQRIRYYRHKVGMSQEKLSFASNLDRTYIGSVERGERNISLINLTKISSALGIQTYELLTVEDDDGK